MCPTLCDSLTAAVLALDYDVFSAAPFKEFATAKFARKILRIGCTGGAAAGDLELHLKYGADLIAILVNTNTGLFVNQSEDMQVIADKRWISPEAQISLLVKDAGNTNPYLIQVELL